MHYRVIYILRRNGFAELGNRRTYAENYFCYDSRFVIALLQEISKNAGEIQREKIGIWVMQNLVGCFYDGIQATNDFFVKYMDNIKYKEVFRKQKKDYLNAIEDNYIKNFSAKVQRIAEERTAVIQQYARQP